MEYTLLGRTGLKVSVAGLGCGGNSKIGRGKGQSTEDSVNLIRHAMDLGVKFLDTAEAYGTERLVGQAIRAIPREQVVVSTKYLAAGVSADRIATAIDTSLRELDTDYIDVFHLHGVKPRDYDHAINVLAPELLRARGAGKIRFLGITETSPNDYGQTMLQRAVNDDCWDVMMPGFNMMHQVARTAVLPRTMDRGIGTLMMFVLRNIFSVPGRLQATMTELAANGQLPGWLVDTQEPLGFLVREGGAENVIDAAYRYVRHEPGADVVLFGTSQIEHLESNIASILKPPLPPEDTAMLAELFEHLKGVGLDLPGPV